MTAYGWTAHIGLSVEVMACAFRARRRHGNEMKGVGNCGKIS